MNRFFLGVLTGAFALILPLVLASLLLSPPEQPGRQTDAPTSLDIQP